MHPQQKIILVASYVAKLIGVDSVRFPEFAVYHDPFFDPFPNPFRVLVLSEN